MILDVRSSVVKLCLAVSVWPLTATATATGQSLEVEEGQRTVRIRTGDE